MTLKIFAGGIIMKKLTRNLSIMLILALLLSAFPCIGKTVSAAATKLSAKSVTMKVGETKTIKLLNSKKRAKWSIEDEKIEVISETKKQIKFKAVDYGTTKIYAMVGKKEYKCKITIKKGQNPIPVPTLQPAPKPTAIPTITPTITPEIKPTIVPTVIPEPTTSPTIKPTIAPTITPILAPKNKLIYKDENVSITYTGISGKENDYDINFLIENMSNRSLVIQVRETSINGFMVSPICSMEVASNKKVEDSMEILGKDAERTPMSEAENIETKFHIFNWDYNFNYDTDNIIIMGNSSGSVDNIENQPTSTPIVEPTASPTIQPIVTPKPTVVFKKDGIEVLSEYTLPDGIGWYTRHFMVIKNSSNKTVDISTSTLAYSNGMIVSAADSSFDALGAGCTSIFYEAFETSAAIDRYVMDMKVTPSEYYESVIQDLSYTQNNIDGGAIFQVTNNGKKAAEFVEGYALFFTGNTLVDYDSTYFTDDNSELKPRATISKQLNIYNNFDRIEFYLTGRRYIG